MRETQPTIAASCATAGFWGGWSSFPIHSVPEVLDDQEVHADGTEIHENQQNGVVAKVNGHCNGTHGAVVHTGALPTNGKSSDAQWDATAAERKSQMNLTNWSLDAFMADPENTHARVTARAYALIMKDVHQDPSFWQRYEDIKKAKVESAPDDQA